MSYSYSAAEKEKLAQGICGKCGNESFYTEITRISGTKLYICKKCETPYHVHDLTPRRLV